MTSSFALLLALSPILFFIPDLLAPMHQGPRPVRMVRWSIGLGAAGLAIALAGLVAAILVGPISSPLIGFAGYGLSIRIDILSMVMATLVSFMGVIVLIYSKNYLDGDPRQADFYGALGTTIALVLLLVMSGNLVQLVLAFVTMSLAFNRLLVFYHERPAALLVARKKFIVARFADASLIIGCGLLITAFGTADINAMLATAKAGLAPDQSGLAAAAAVCIAVAAIQKSAQFPFHFWLPEVMETPTPVSALLHAGIINAGGFLVLRLADIMVLSPHGLHLLALVGGFTALIAGLVMITQTTAKGSLAWSTIAQMGFMTLQCGLGLFPLALLHIVAHSLYKAHAFLSAGGVVARSAGVQPAPAQPGFGRMTLALIVAAVLYIGIGLAFGLGPNKAPAILVMGAVLVLGVTPMLAGLIAGPVDRLRILTAFGLTAGIVVAYFTLQSLATLAFGPAFPAPPAPDAVSIFMLVLVLVGFGFASIVQMIGFDRINHPLAALAWVHLHNGLYINHWVNRQLAGRPATLSNAH